MFKLFRRQASLAINKLFIFNESWLTAIMFTFFAFFTLRVGTIMCHMSHGIPPAFLELNNFSNSRALPVGYDINDSCGFYVSKQMTADFPTEEWKKSAGYSSESFPVRAVADGMVYFCGNCMDDRGRIVRVLHNTRVGEYVSDIESIYSGLDEIVVENGRVVAGQLLGYVEPDESLRVQIRGCIGAMFTSSKKSGCEKNYASSSKW